MNKAAAFIADLFFPNRCPICGSYINYDCFICEICNSQLSPVHDDICLKCGKIHRECICDKICYDKAFVCFYYEGIAKTGIFSLKDGHKEFGYFIGRLLGEMIAETGLKADGVVPVPMSKKSYRKRRYNQAKVIAEKIADINKLPVLTDIIFKNESDVQHNLSRTERRKNTSAFYGGNKSLDNMKIILCDDVITTGSTLDRCAGILKEMGAAAVYAAAGTTTKLKRNEGLWHKTSESTSGPQI